MWLLHKKAQNLVKIITKSALYKTDLMHKLQVPQCGNVWIPQYYLPVSESKNYLYSYILSKNTLIVKLELFELIWLTTSFSASPEMFNFFFFTRCLLFSTLPSMWHFHQKNKKNSGWRESGMREHTVTHCHNKGNIQIICHLGNA